MNQPTAANQPVTYETGETSPILSLTIVCLEWDELQSFVAKFPNSPKINQGSLIFQSPPQNGDTFVVKINVEKCSKMNIQTMIENALGGQIPALSNVRSFDHVTRNNGLILKVTQLRPLDRQNSMRCIRIIQLCEKTRARSKNIPIKIDFPYVFYQFYKKRGKNVSKKGKKEIVINSAPNNSNICNNTNQLLLKMAERVRLNLLDNQLTFDEKLKELMGFVNSQSYGRSFRGV